MKKFLKCFTTICMVLFMGILLVACEEPLQKQDGGTKVHMPTITSWYEYEQESYLDTSVNINFDEIKIADIKKITFELYDGETLLGNAVSEGNNLVSLLKDAANYWEQTEERYLDVTGDRTLSCAFKTRTEQADNGFWVRSKCTATPEEVPDGLIVKVVVGNIEYTTSNIETTTQTTN